jgi:TolB-like protein/Tfp pilus assembly protein PilF
MIAVLPFSDLSENENGRYFSQGMTEEIITQLGRTAPAGVGVIAGTSVWRYHGQNPPPRALGDELGAAYVLAGSLRREGSALRINARLLRTRDELQLWAEAFDGASGDALALQERVAQAAAQAVARELRRAAGPGMEARGRIDPRAYDLYLRGRFYWNQRNESSLLLAIDYFQQALTHAPAYAPAFAALADVYAALVYGCYLAPTEGFSQARAAVERARTLDPASAEALASDGYLKMYFDWDFDAAERSFEASIAANPSYAPAREWLGVLLTAREKPGPARAALEQAVRLDPGSLPSATNLGFHLHYSGHDREARQVLARVVARDPNFGLAHFWMGRVLNAEGDCNGALAELASVPSTMAQWQPLIAARGYVEGNCGAPERARAEIAALSELAKTRFVTSYGMALIAAGLGEKDTALTWLRKAIEERSHWMVWINLDPRFAALRPDPRFQELARKVFSRREF